MWSYYGSKSKIVHLYPKPKYNKIREPFAGSARYALRYFENEVLLIDKDPKVVKMWKFLQQCTPRDILGLPSFVCGDDIRKFNLSEDEKLFCGFLIGKGLRRPQNIVCPFAGKTQPTWIPWQKKKIAASLFKIKHWTIKQGEFTDLINEPSTTFIDGPYQFGGEWYTFGNQKIDFVFLSEWIRGLMGQVIVCENTKATWLPFSPMKLIQGTKYKTTEAIWTNEPTHYDNIQQKLFNFTT